MDWVLVGVMGAGLIFRFALWKAFRMMISFDEANYLRLAGHAMQTNLLAILHPYWPPFYPFLVWCFSVFGSSPETAGRLVNIIFGTSLIPLVYYWTNRIFSKNEARIAAAAAAFYPPLAFDSTSAMPETIYSITALTGMIFGWLAISRNKWHAGLLAGICWAFAYLAKPEGIGFLIVYLLFLSACWIIRKNIISAYVKTGIMVCMGFLVVASPYLIYLHHSTGHWTISTKGMVNQQMEAAVAFDDGPMKDPFFHVTKDNQYLPYDMAMHYGNFHELRTLADGREHLMHISIRHYVIKYAQNFYQLLKETIPQLFGILFLIPLILGLFSPVANSQKVLSVYLLCTIGFFWFGVVPLFHVNIRYLAPLFPLFFIWIGTGFQVLYRYIAGLISGPLVRKQAIASLLLVLLAGGILIPELAVIARNNRPGTNMWAPPLELKSAGIWLKKHSDVPPRLMTLNKAIDYYAGQFDMKQGASFSYDPVEINLVYAQNRQCQYLVFSSRYLTWFKNLTPLVEDVDPAGLKRVYDKHDSTGIHTVIYQLE